MVYFKIEDEEGLKKVGAVVPARFSHPFHHVCLATKLLGIAMHNQARLTIPGVCSTMPLVFRIMLNG